eukprot:maker-scaffold1028_size131186-snap-gene-0.44 protein:Tk10618 transcript:maker-scaffold1028_size131186-snap-gene-0.44-mRNA-1 annotation:"hypothetical protein "
MERADKSQAQSTMAALHTQADQARDEEKHELLAENGKLTQALQEAQHSQGKSAGKVDKLELEVRRLEAVKVDLEFQLKDARDQSLRERRDWQKCSKEKDRQIKILFQAVRKQAELAHILKQQKLHLEALKVLDFTESEFAETLEWCPKESMATSENIDPHRLSTDVSQKMQ